MMKLSLVAAAAVAGGLSSVQAQDAVRILHVNDFHSYMEGIGNFNGPCDRDLAEDGCDGGWPRLFTAVKAAVAEATDQGMQTIFVDDGDMFMGSLYSTFFRGQEVSTFMNELCSSESIGLAACVSTLGNHEFDYGVPNLVANYTKLLNASTLISTNLVDNCEGDARLGDTYEPSTVVELANGLRVGFVAYTVSNVANIVADFPDCIEVQDEATAIGPVVASMKAEGENKVDLVVVVGHSGYDKDQEVASSVEGINLIIGGHTHSHLWSADAPYGDNPIYGNGDNAPFGPITPAGDYPTIVNSVPIVQAFSYGRFMGRMDLSLNDNGEVEAIPSPVMLGQVNSTSDDGFEFVEDEDALALLAPLKAQIGEFGGSVIGSLDQVMDGGREFVRVTENPLGNLICDSMLDYANELDIAETGAVTVCLQNGGGIRATLEAGDVTIGNVLSVLPFGNSLAVIEVTGAQLYLMAENGGTPGTGAFATVGKGMSIIRDFTIPAACESGGGGTCTIGVEVTRTLAITLDGVLVPNDDSVTYRMVTSSFLAAGNDGYVMLAGSPFLFDNGPTQDAVLIEYIQDGKEIVYETDCRLVDIVEPGSCSVDVITSAPTEEEESSSAAPGIIIVIVALALLGLFFVKKKGSEDSSSESRGAPVVVREDVV